MAPTLKDPQFLNPGMDSNNRIAQTIADMPRSIHCRDLARPLCDALEAAIRSGHLSRAKRLAKSAARFNRRGARLSQLLAQLCCLEGDHESALRILDTSTSKSASLRLTRVKCLIQLGRRAEAHLELSSWADRATSPMEARMLCALLDWEAGDKKNAVESIQKKLRQHEDPDSLALLTVLNILMKDRDATSRWAVQLFRFAVYPTMRDSIRLLLGSLGLAQTFDNPEPDETEATDLALELKSAQSILPVLLRAQRRKFDEPSARLLMSALIQARDQFANPADAYSYIAELSFRIQGNDSAKKWIEEGLAKHPMSASLRLMLDQLNEVDVETIDTQDQSVLAVIGGSDTEKPAKGFEQVEGKAA